MVEQNEDIDWQGMLKLMELALPVVIVEDIKLLKELAKR